MAGRAPALAVTIAFVACDGPIRLDVVTAIPTERSESGGTAGSGNTGNAGNSGAGNEASGGSAGSTEDGGAGGEVAGAGGEPFLPWAAPALYRASFAAFALPGEYVRHRSSEGFVTPIDPVTVDAVDATFEVINAVIGDDDSCFSIRRLAGGYSLLRHFAGRIRFDEPTGENIYLLDATFCFRPGLAEETWVSFQSFNYPNHYIRVRTGTAPGNELWIDRDDGSPEFAADATFRIENPFEQPEGL